jgi:hypothetical protein
MSNKTFINGSIEITNSKFFQILKSIDSLSQDKIQLKLQDFGYEIMYESDDIYFYVYGNESEKENEILIFDCEYKSQDISATTFINSIVQKLTDNGVKYYKFGLEEVDENGELVGEEHEIKS